MQSWVICALVVGLGHAWDDSGFLNWFKDELRESYMQTIFFEGHVPSYLTGTFSQAGPGRFTMGSDRFTHLMDGFSKTNAIHVVPGGTTTFTSQFLRSNFYKASVRKNGIARGMFVGPINPPKKWGPTAAMGHNDNNYIKTHKIGNQTMLMADITLATALKDLDSSSFDHDVSPKLLKILNPGHVWKDDIEPAAHLCMLGTMAHGFVDTETGVFTGAMGCNGVPELELAYHSVFTISPSDPEKRISLAKIPLPRGRGPSYMHALGSTPDHVVLIAEPLYMSMMNALKGDPLGWGTLQTTNDETIFHVVNRNGGFVRDFRSPGFIYGHVLNTWEEGGDTLIDFTWYPAGNMSTLGWFKRFDFGNVMDKGIRETWPKTQIKRYRLHADGKVTNQVLFADEDGNDDFEVPKINDKRSGLSYCIVYMLQFHSYEYDKDQNSTVPGPMGAVGIAKRNICTGQRQGWYTPNHYPSEVHFVPNPGGTAEDDGVLTGMVFDANTNTSYFHILDARTMTRTAKADLPINHPFLIHSSWFPDSEAVLTEQIIV